jgi:hypothetical protein
MISLPRHRARSVLPAAVLVASAVLVRGAAAQAVTEWRTETGLPVAVVEIAGGDVEHLTALVPAKATPPTMIAGWPTAAAARPGALLWSLAVPATMAAQAAVELAGAVAATGCGAVAAVGPVPARELTGPLAGLAAVAGPLAARPACALADGRDEVVRGADERVELLLGVPQPADPRFESLPAVAAVLERRLAGSLPGVRAGIELRDGCWRLAVHPVVGDEAVRSVLRRLREAIAAAITAPVAEAELAAAAAPLRRGAVALASDGAAVGAELVERLAAGGRAAGALAPVVPGPAAVTELLRELAGGRAGTAVLTEAERRGRPEAPETLPNGVILSTRWIAEDTGVLALAFGSLDPAAGAPLTSALATRLASGGWNARPGEVAGIPVVTAVVPPDDVPEALEAATDALSAPLEPVQASLLGDVAAAIGLHDGVAAETLSLALALPPDAEEGVEAARKFLSQVVTGGVRSSGSPAGPRLAWTPDAAAPRLAAVVELPALPAGWLAGEVVAARAETELGARSRWLSPAGGLALVLVAEGEAHVPALDARLGAGWSRLRRPVAEAELEAAARRLYARLYGDLVAATARAAVSPFLPGIPAEAVLLAPDAAEVNATLAALPPWETLLRVARGAAPAVVPPPVRKSPGKSQRAPAAPATNSP